MPTPKPTTRPSAELLQDAAMVHQIEDLGGIGAGESRDGMLPPRMLQQELGEVLAQ